MWWGCLLVLIGNFAICRTRYLFRNSISPRETSRSQIVKINTVKIGVEENIYQLGNGCKIKYQQRQQQPKKKKNKQTRPSTSTSVFISLQIYSINPRSKCQVAYILFMGLVTLFGNGNPLTILLRESSICAWRTMCNTNYISKWKYRYVC